MSAHTPIDDDLDGSSAPLIEHLKELRTRIIWSVLALVVAMILAYLVWNPIYNFLTRPICAALEERGQECGLILLKLQEGFSVAIRIAFFGGYAFLAGLLLAGLARVVRPGRR